VLFIFIFMFIFFVTCTGSSHEDDRPPSTVNFNFIVPKKEISMVPDMGKWKRSQVCFTTHYETLLH